MKRLILAVLPILLAAQIPLNVTKFVPTDWKRNFDFGVKWTELLLNSYFSDSDNESKVPDGVVTTTVILASIPEFDEDDQLMIDQETCRVQLEIARESEKTEKIQKNFEQKYRIIQIKSRTIQL